MREETHACLCAQPGHWFGPVTRLGLLGSAQPHGSSWTQPPKKTSNIVVFFVFFLWFFFVFLYCKNTNLVFRIPGFQRNVTYIYIYVCMHTANTLTCFERFVIKKILEVSKMYFRMDFLNTTKKLFSCISGFYNMFIKLQRVLANISKNTKNLILGGIHLLFTLMFE